MAEVRFKCISRNIIENAFTYEEYRSLINRLLEDSKTTGENHSERMLHYTKMNVHRMNRLDKKTELADDVKHRLASVNRNITWLVLTEAWCGDAAQAIPAIQKMADYSDKIHTRYILRDEHIDIMDQFLTNGNSRSIPKLIALDSITLDILGTWGPRPAIARDLYTELRSRADVSGREAAERLHKWYADDKTRNIQKEILALLDSWEHA